MSANGKLYMMVQKHNYKGPAVVVFLRPLLRHAPGKLLVLPRKDQAPNHRNKVNKDFLARGGAARIQLEPLPAYAPELNPDKGAGIS